MVRTMTLEQFAWILFGVILTWAWIEIKDRNNDGGCA